MNKYQSQFKNIDNYKNNFLLLNISRCKHTFLLDIKQTNKQTNLIFIQNKKQINKQVYLNTLFLMKNNLISLTLYQQYYIFKQLNNILSNQLYEIFKFDLQN
ncbi:hypothetical protein ABPG72_004816 [Tetrahymena utriculariae]